MGWTLGWGVGSSFPSIVRTGGSVLTPLPQFGATKPISVPLPARHPQFPDGGAPERFAHKGIERDGDGDERAPGGSLTLQAALGGGFPLPGDAPLLGGLLLGTRLPEPSDPSD